MSGSIKVGGNTIATHTGAQGAGEVTLGTNLRLPASGGIQDSSGNNILTESGGNVSLGNLRLPASGGIKDSSGNNILTESGGNVSVGNVRLPVSGGIKDSSGNNALSESGGVVTLTATNIHNSDGLKILEVVSWSPGNNDNKTPNTIYDYSTSLAAGTWLSFMDCYVAIFEAHANSNSVGVYNTYVLLGSTSGGNEYGQAEVTLPKWGNSTNSYSNITSKVNQPFTLASTSTVYLRWSAVEYGTSSNFWVRNGSVLVNFLRIA